MGKIHIKDPEHFQKLLREIQQKVRARVEESILAAVTGAPIKGLSSVTTANVAEPRPMAVDDILAYMRDGVGAVCAPAYYDILEQQGFKVDPEPPFRWITAMSYPIYPTSTAALARLLVDPGSGCDEFPTLRAELTLPDTPELRRTWRLYNTNRKDPRRVKRCLRLFRRLVAQAAAA